MKKHGKYKLILALGLLMNGLPVCAVDNTNILVEEAVNHIYQQRYQKAHQVLKTAYEQSPRHPGVHFNLGRLFELTGNFAEALKEYRLAASLDTSMVSAKRGVARCTVEMKRIQAAQVQTQIPVKAVSAPIVTQSMPGTAPVITQSAAPLIKQQPAPSQQIVLTQGTRPPSQSILPSMSNKPVQTTQTYTPAQNLPLPNLPIKSGTTEESKAENLLQNGKTDEAITLLNKMLDKNPDNQSALFLMGKAMSIKNDLFSSIKYLEESLRVNPKLYEAYYLLGQNYSKVNLLEDALKNYITYYNVRQQAGIAAEIARIYESMGNQAKARDYYARANAMNPGNTNLQQQLSETSDNAANELYLQGCHAFSMNNFSEAENLLGKALTSGRLEKGAHADAVEKMEISRFRLQEEKLRQAPAKAGYAQTQKNYAVNIKYSELSNISPRTQVSGPIVIEWRGYIAKKTKQNGRDAFVMIKYLSRDELDEMGKSTNDFKLNKHYVGQPLFLLTAPKGGFPSFMRTGKMVTFNGSSEWKNQNVPNEYGQIVSLPVFEFISAYPE